MDQITPLLTQNVAEIFPSKQALEKALKERKLKVYLGVDPSSAEIHLGHTVLLEKLRLFQDLGHEVILLIGDFTGMIGDPTGKDKARVPLTREQVKANAKTYKEQAEKILSFAGKNPAKILYNSTWLDKLDFRQIIDLASKFTVQQLLERDMFQERLKAGKPISLHEFLYPLMQGYDSVAMDVDVEIGGTDQTFNMLVGRQLVRDVLGKEKSVLTANLLPGLNGEKMSKSASNTIAITAEAKEMFGKVMSLNDNLISIYFEALLGVSSPKKPPMESKLQLAKEIVKKYHGEKKAEEASLEFNRVVQKRQRPTAVPRVSKLAPSETMTVQELIRFLEMAPSNSAAVRLIEQGAVEINGMVRKHPKERVEVKGKLVKIKVGKRGFIDYDGG